MGFRFRMKREDSPPPKGTEQAQTLIMLSRQSGSSVHIRRIQLSYQLFMSVDVVE